MSRRERREAERAAEQHWPPLRLPVAECLWSALPAVGAMVLFTEGVTTLALGAGLAVLIRAVMAIAAQVLRRPPAVPLHEYRVVASATARGTGRAPRTPGYGIPVAPSIDGRTPEVPRQRLHAR